MVSNLPRHLHIYLADNTPRAYFQTTETYIQTNETYIRSYQI